jgi:cytochrome c
MIRSPPFQAARSLIAPLVAAVLFAGCIPGLATAAGTSSVNRGRDLVERNCGMCHATGPVGASPNPASPAFRDLHLRYPVENLAEALGEGILTGHPQMPEFRFNPTEVEDIIHYLQSIQTRQPASAEPRGPRSRGG